MNEVLLIIVFLALLVVTQGSLDRFNQPLRTYVQLLSAGFLLVLVWGFGEGDTWTPRLVLTVVALITIIRIIIEYRKSALNTGQGQKD